MWWVDSPWRPLEFFSHPSPGTKDVSGVIIVFTSPFLPLEMSSLFCPSPPFQLLHFSSLAAPTVYRAAEVSEYWHILFLLRGRSTLWKAKKPKVWNEMTTAYIKLCPWRWTEQIFFRSRNSPHSRWAGKGNIVCWCDKKKWTLEAGHAIDISVR